MVKVIFASLFTVVSAGSCSSDDQAALADAQNVGEKQDACGKKALSLTGINHDKFTSCVQSDLGISADCSECYYTVADYGFKNCKAACLLGWCKSGCLSCTQSAQDGLSACTGFQPAVAEPCLESGLTGACSADDQSALADPQVVGKAGSDCGLSSYNPLTGFNHDKFKDCFKGKLTVSDGCSSCFADNGAFAAKNCKVACLTGWCKQGCLDCSTASEPKAALDACTGYTSGSAEPCLESTAGACSADDFAALDALPQGTGSGSVGELAGDCGKGAYNIITGNFNHDKFKSCLVGKVALGDGCAECFAASGDYGAANCKTACLLGWCKAGCLDCTAPAQQTQSTCMGRDLSPVDPCADDVAV